MKESLQLALNTFISALVGAMVPILVSWLRNIVKQNKADEAGEDDKDLATSNNVSNEVVKNGESDLSFDTSKYSIDGQEWLGKGRLVLAVIKKYVKDNPGVSYGQLTNAFPPSVRGLKRTTRWGCFVPSREARELYVNTGIKRHFLKEDELIVLANGEEIAVSSQWGIGNIGPFLARARELGFKILEEK